MNDCLIYGPLFWAFLLVGFSATTYYLHKYEIKDSSTLNKFKLSSQNILIKLKLFKYDNNFNYFLLIPYLIAWNLLFIAFIIYIIYWFGVSRLGSFLSNKYVNFFGVILILLYMGYAACIQPVILHSNGLDSPNFFVDDKTIQEEQRKIDSQKRGKSGEND